MVVADGLCHPPARKVKGKNSEMFFSFVTFSQGVRVIFFKERKPSPLFNFHQLQSRGLNVIHLKLFREQADMQPLNHVRTKKEREIITATIEMASDLFSVFSGLAGVRGLIFDICENGLSVVRSRFRPEFPGPVWCRSRPGASLIWCLAISWQTAEETFHVRST